MLYVIKFSFNYILKFQIIKTNENLNEVSKTKELHNEYAPMYKNL